SVMLTTNKKPTSVPKNSAGTGDPATPAQAGLGTDHGRCSRRSGLTRRRPPGEVRAHGPLLAPRFRKQAAQTPAWHNLAMAVSPVRSETVERLGLSLFYRVGNTPLFKKIHKYFYALLTRWLGADDVVFINWGYEEDPPMGLPLAASDEPNRYYI